MTHLRQIKGTSDYGGYGYNFVRSLSAAQNLNHADTYTLFAQCKLYRAALHDGLGANPLTLLSSHLRRLLSDSPLSVTRGGSQASTTIVEKGMDFEIVVFDWGGIFLGVAPNAREMSCRSLPCWIRIPSSADVGVTNHMIFYQRALVTSRVYQAR